MCRENVGKGEDGGGLGCGPGSPVVAKDGPRGVATGGTERSARCGKRVPEVCCFGRGGILGTVPAVFRQGWGWRETGELVCPKKGYRIAVVRQGTELRPLWSLRLSPFLGGWLKNRIHLTCIPLRPAFHMTKDMLPGSYPRTPEERAAAAKKYNMRVEDYEPYPDDGMGFGDYPMLPNRSQHERDPWYDWDHPDLRLNWGEPLHWDLDMYIRNRVDTSPTPVSWDVMCKHLFGFVAFMVFMFWIGDMFPSYQPVGPKQYPYNNLYLERGGDPTKEPEPVVHYEI